MRSLGVNLSCPALKLNSLLVDISAGGDDIKGSWAANPKSEMRGNHMSGRRPTFTRLSLHHHHLPPPTPFYHLPRPHPHPCLTLLPDQLLPQRSHLQNPIAP
jgi:hypothetical protein